MISPVPSSAAPLLSQFLGQPAELVDLLIAEQQSLTAVDRFSVHHDESKGHDQERYYRDLLPLREPQAGEHFAFEVDLDRCSGCKACVTACHSLNGLDEDETWRQVGLLHEPAGNRMQQTITTACHHCADPACANGCPTLAYEKDPVTGIVRHLDDQCFGCQYCILKCPYDVPQFNAKRGIVRKCDMCVGRLRAGEAPACVQACPTQAIRIVLQETEVVRRDPKKNFGLANAPDPEYTLPTTRYVSTKPVVGTPVDAFQIRAEHAHMALVWMLVMSQMAAGFWIFHALQTAKNLFVPSHPPVRFPVTEATGLGLVVFALNLSLLHLGRPLLAWKAFLGWRRSWLSREVIAFSALAGTASIATAIAALKWINSLLPPVIPGWIGNPDLKTAALTATALAAAAVLYSSSMVYRDTPRVLWATRNTLWKFSLSAVLCGGAAYLLVAGWNSAVASTLPFALMIKFALEARVLRHRDDEDPNPLWKAAQLLTGPLGKIRRLRIALGLTGGAIFPLLLIPGVFPGAHLHLLFASMMLLLITGGELLERYLFFTTAVAPRMPGGR